MRKALIIFSYFILITNIHATEDPRVVSIVCGDTQNDNNVYEKRKYGSGVIVGSKHLLTAKHVIERPEANSQNWYSECRIHTRGQETNYNWSFKPENAIIDPYGNDIALIELNDSYPKERSFNTFCSESVEQYDEVIAIGYPMIVTKSNNKVNYGTHSHEYNSSYAIKSLGLRKPLGHINNIEEGKFETNHKFSGGMSGGALTDKNGNLIGIIKSYYSNGNAISIPIHYFKELWNDRIEGIKECPTISTKTPKTENTSVYTYKAHIRLNTQYSSGFTDLPEVAKTGQISISVIHNKSTIEADIFNSPKEDKFGKYNWELKSLINLDKKQLKVSQPENLFFHPDFKPQTTDEAQKYPKVKILDSYQMGMHYLNIARKSTKESFSKSNCDRSYDSKRNCWQKNNETHSKAYTTITNNFKYAIDYFNHDEKTAKIKEKLRLSFKELRDMQVNFAMYCDAERTEDEALYEHEIKLKDRKITKNKCRASEPTLEELINKITQIIIKGIKGCEKLVEIKNPNNIEACIMQKSEINSLEKDHRELIKALIRTIASDSNFQEHIKKLGTNATEINNYLLSYSYSNFPFLTNSIVSTTIKPPAFVHPELYRLGEMVSLTSKKTEEAKQIHISRPFELERESPEALELELEASETAILMTSNAMTIQEVPAAQVNIKPIEEIIYKLKKGDSLRGIATATYGDSEKYKLILKANPKLIKNENKIFTGQEIRIPIIPHIPSPEYTSPQDIRSWKEFYPVEKSPPRFPTEASGQKPTTILQPFHNIQFPQQEPAM